jgi:hypothetical protein
MKPFKLFLSICLCVGITQGITFAKSEPDKFVISAKLTDKNKVKLSWITPIAYKTSSFLIQRSADGVNFDEIAKADAFFDPVKRNLYTFTDNDATTGTFYYRLIENKEDGSTQIHETMTISVNEAMSYKIQVVAKDENSQEIRLFGEFSKSSFDVIMGREDSGASVVSRLDYIVGGVSLKPLYTLSEGEYFIKIRSNGSVKKYKFSIKE